MKYIYLLCLFLVVSCSNQNQLSYFCKINSGDFFDYFIELNINSNEGTIKRVLNIYGYENKKAWDDMLEKSQDDPDKKKELNEDAIDMISNTFKETEVDIFIREVTEVFVTFSTFKEINEDIDTVYTLNRTNLELREVTTYSDWYYSVLKEGGLDKETIDYYECEAPKV